MPAEAIVQRFEPVAPAELAGLKAALVATLPAAEQARLATGRNVIVLQAALSD